MDPSDAKKQRTKKRDQKLRKLRKQNKTDDIKDTNYCTDAGGTPPVRVHVIELLESRGPPNSSNALTPPFCTPPLN